jgi:predicted ATPase
LSIGRTRQLRITSQHNLPALRSSFVGREREMATTRLLTLTGAGGSGKTRLALEVARDLMEAYPDGVWFVELAPLSEKELVPKAVAEALQVPERPQEPIADILVEVLGDRQLLLVVDNCEHLIEAVAGLADRLLDSCPRLRILATSREGLGVEGEAKWPVPPLSAPEQEHMSSPMELEAYESVRLFVERARGRDPAFSLSPENAISVAEICRRLEGIPLAIELAVARVGTLSLDQISDRLGGSLKLLTHGGRTALPRQQTLKGTLDWSHDLLSEAEKVLFRRLSVFAGGWTLEALEAVGSGEGIEVGKVLDLLSGLVEKSLVVARGSDQRGLRYRLLETIRQYAREQIEAEGEAEEVLRRHAEFFLALAEEAGPGLRGPEDVQWLERLEEEHDNMRAALSWTLERQETELGLRLAGALFRFWEAHGHFREGSRWLEKALEKNGGASDAARAKALEGFGWLVYLTRSTDRAVAAGEEGLELSRHAGLGSAVTADLLRLLGWMAWTKGDYERAKELLEEGLALSRSANDRFGVADALPMLGSTVGSMGDRKRDKQLQEEAMALCRELGYSSTLATSLFSMGYGLLMDGEYERGEALIEEAATLSRERGYKDTLLYAVNNLGWAALLQGDHERARISYRESLTLCKEFGDKMIAPRAWTGLRVSARPKAKQSGRPSCSGRGRHCSKR